MRQDAAVVQSHYGGAHSVACYQAVLGAGIDHSYQLVAGVIGGAHIVDYWAVDQGGPRVVGSIGAVHWQNVARWNRVVRDDTVPQRTIGTEVGHRVAHTCKGESVNPAGGVCCCIAILIDAVAVWYGNHRGMSREVAQGHVVCWRLVTHQTAIDVHAGVEIDTGAVFALGYPHLGGGAILPVEWGGHIACRA